MAGILKRSKTKGEIKRAMARLFKRDNPRFDLKRFLKAAMKRRKK